MPVHQDTGPEDIEIVFVTVINTLARKYGCKIIDCDYEKRYIELDCPDGADQLQLSLELEKFLKQWSV